MTLEESVWKRVARVKAAAWLSVTDLCFHCGVGQTKMREWMRLPDFPQAATPGGSWKEARYEKKEVDAWLRAHRRLLSV